MQSQIWSASIVAWCSSYLGVKLHKDFSEVLPRNLGKMMQILMSICFKRFKDGGVETTILGFVWGDFFYFVPLQITIKPPFGRICFIFSKYLKQIHCYFVGFKLESYPLSRVQKYPATRKLDGVTVSKTRKEKRSKPDPKLQNHLLLGFFHMFVGVGGIPEMVANQIWGSSRRPDIFFAFFVCTKKIPA